MADLVVDAPGQHLLGEAHNVWRDAEVFVGPHLTSASSSCLDLVNHEGDVVLFADRFHALEEEGRTMEVSSLSLERFTDHSSHRHAIYCRLYNFLLHINQTPIILCFVVVHVFF